MGDNKNFMLRVRMGKDDRKKLVDLTKEMGEESMSTIVRQLIRRAYAEIVVPRKFPTSGAS